KKPTHGGARPGSGPKPKRPEERHTTKARQLGRVSDESWERLQSMAKASGKSFTQWAVEKLLRPDPPTANAS
ncbi:MAG TPA: hypothetical protein VGM98_00490, partial [Schlesneria sp.]